MPEMGWHGYVGDGKISVSPVEKIVRIRTVRNKYFM
jgi:nitrogen regulatory protein PII